MAKLKVGCLGEATRLQPSLQVTKHSLYFIAGPNAEKHRPPPCHPSGSLLLGPLPATTLEQSPLIKASPWTWQLGSPCSVVHPTPKVNGVGEGPWRLRLLLHPAAPKWCLAQGGQAPGPQ